MLLHPKSKQVFPSESHGKDPVLAYFIEPCDFWNPSEKQTSTQKRSRLLQEMHHCLPPDRGLVLTGRWQSSPSSARRLVGASCGRLLLPGSLGSDSGPAFHTEPSGCLWAAPRPGWGKGRQRHFFRHRLPLSRSSDGHGVFLLLEMTSSPFTGFFVGASALLLLQFQ